MALAGVSVHVLVLAVSAGITAGLSVYSWRQRPDPGTRPFAALMLCVTVWTASVAIGLTVPATEESLRLFWEQMLYVGVAPLPVFWFAFAVEYSGVEFRLTRRRVGGLLVLPAVALVAAWTVPLHDLFWTPVEIAVVSGGFGAQVTVIFYEFGPLWWVYYVYAFSLLGVGAVLLVRTSVTADHLYIDQAVALIVGVVVPAVANVASVAGVVPVDGMDFTPHAYVLTGIAFGNALFRYRFLDRLPATRRAGRDTVVRDMDDGVVVVDDTQEVIDVNPVAEEVFGEDKRDLVGRPARSVFADVLGETGDDGDVVDALDGQEFETEDGSWFEVRVSPMVDQRGQSTGDVLVFRDVTGRRAREQRLTVLNRLLRHNFRNEMTVISGYAELLGDRLEADDADLAERIEEVASRLTRHADKAQNVERLTDREETDYQPVDLRELVIDVVADVESRFPDVEIQMDVPPGLYGRSDGSLKTVVENLVENAAKHNEGESQSVEVTVRRVEDGDVEITVADDGPGIPDHEWEVLEEGTETQLKHGSGIGLWIVYWGTTALEGEVTFEGTEGEGTVVRLRVPEGDPGVSPAADPSGTRTESETD